MQVEMRRRHEAGVSDSVEDLNAGVNGGSAPPFDQNLVGKWIEVPQGRRSNVRTPILG